MSESVHPSLARRLWWLLPLLAIVAADWGSKVLARRLEQQQIELIPWLLDLRLVFNRGIAFGFFADSPEWGRLFIAALSSLLAGFGLYQLLRPAGGTLTRIGWMLFVGGAMGNLWERLLLGQVTDFLALHLHQWPLFVFNLADASLTCSIVVLVLDELLSRQPPAARSGEGTG